MRNNWYSLSLLALALFIHSFASAQTNYKEMMNDPSVNFYDVCAAAERYFQTHDPAVKGSGWKGYQRWRSANEYKYYPSGDRSQIDPFFASNAFKAFLHQDTARRQQRLFNNGWQELGPYTIDSITGHYAVGLGRVEDFYVNPSDTNLIYLGSRSGGFWKTTNGGTTWQGGASDFLMASGVNTIGVSPTNPDSILINVRNSRNGYSHGVYRSVDGGQTFAISNFNPTNVGFGGLGDNFIIYRIAYHPTIPNLVFIGTNEGLYRSDNNLTSWVRLLNPGQISYIEFHPTDPNIVYAYDRRSANRDYVYRSTNAGQSFSQSNQIAANGGSTGRLSVSADCASCLYFASNNGVWRSVDTGQNYTYLGNGGAGNGGFAVNDQDTSKILHGYVDLVTSNDGGQSFNQVTWWALGNSNHGSGNLASNFANTHKYVHADLRVARSVNGAFYVGTDGYISKSNNNGASWVILSEGTAIRENYRLGTSQSNHYRTVSGSQDNGTSIKVKDGWVEFYGADGMEAIIHPLNYNWMMASFQYGGRRLSKNGGLTSSSGQPSGQSGSGNADWIAPLRYDPNDHMRIYHYSQSVWVSDRFGGSWVQLGSPVTFTGNIQQAVVAENNSDIMLISRGQFIEKSVDGGLTFTGINNNLPTSSIRSIAFDPNDDDVIALCYSSYQANGQKIFLSTNGGSTWSNITYNLGDMPLQSVVIDHSDSSYIYVGAEIGIFVKSMAGNTWSLYNPNFPNTSVLDLEINYGSNTLKAATWGRGLWEYHLKDRADYPAILTTAIDDLPTDQLPAEGSDQYVTSVISYANNLTSVYVEWSADSAVFGNVIPMVNTVDSTWKSQSPLPRYPIGSKLFFKVFAVGANNDTSETYKFMYEVRPFQLCYASGSTGTGSDYIDFMSLGSYSNSTGQDYYRNFSNALIDLYKDSTYTLQVDLNVAFAPDSCQAWIDYNHNAVFNQDEAIVMSGFDANNQAFGTFTVPSLQNFGDTVTLRIRNAYGASPEPCGVVAGEVEDYSIVLRNGSCTNSSSTLNPNICGPSYTAPDGQIYYTSGNYSATILNAGGCDSLITINLQIGANSSSTLNPLVCTPSYIAPDGQTYTSSGVYSAVIPNASGCDSLITINLTVGDTSTSSISPVICGGNYVAPDGWVYSSSGTYFAVIPNAVGCDSLISINLTVNQNSSSAVTVNSCGIPYVAPDSQVYTSSGIYTATIPNTVGCDSVITTTFTISNLNASVSVSGNTLSAVSPGLTYQWLNCDSGYSPVSGANAQSFTPQFSGNYALEVSDINCRDTSACTNVTLVGLENPMDLEAHIYPNPTQSSFQVEISTRVQNLEVRVMDVSGKVLLRQNGNNTSLIKMDLNVAAGMYFVEVVADGRGKVFKLRKE